MIPVAPCASLAEVRHRIDRVDRQLAAAFIEREHQHHAALHPPSPPAN